MKNGKEFFQISGNLQNGFSSHSQLCELADSLKNTLHEKVIIDFSGTEFIASNLFAVLGCIFGEYKNEDSKKSLMVQGIKASLCDVIQKNGFCRHMGLKQLPDVYNTTIPYKIFDVAQIVEYERYLTISLFNRKDLPHMSKEVSDNIKDSLLEIFKNVIDHTDSRNVYTCGQYFPKSNILYFTIVDAGDTIPFNVNRYHKLHFLKTPEWCLEWAVKTGNTTLDTYTPRGIGLSLITNFVHLNNGCFYIISGKETYEILNNKKERYRLFEHPFPGTIVTIGFNLNDKAAYYMSSEKNSNIIF